MLSFGCLESTSLQYKINSTERVANTEELTAVMGQPPGSRSSQVLWEVTSRPRRSLVSGGLRKASIPDAQGFCRHQGLAPFG